MGNPHHLQTDQRIEPGMRIQRIEKQGFRTIS